ncbi:DNA-processing protein DprA [Mycobacterium sp. 236(2023)]|uniref:DNA-processing protein DprA n=1 Tax=Mycobacterium sp. 236(2023) TaxID=3038163 RepID=UPI002415790A|nr:DNA-processing protein DprA [Mycobacterium sp. 236(2023)]MDG4667340.1 DNA-processing protein DprA [Mycobacterium sp. 236(2023)]
MCTDAHGRLQFAIAAVRFGGGQRTIATRVRTEGIPAFERLLNALHPDDLRQVEEQAQALVEDGVDAVLLGQDRYPELLGLSRQAPAVLFIKGPAQLLARRAIGMCGSRQASSEGLRAAHACADAVARRGYSVVSGYAKGVDLVAHSAALASGGETVIVLPEGINNFRVRRGEFAQLWDSERALVVSQFAPDQKWFASGAMSRNTVISGLSHALVVVEAGDKGGTLAAGEYALQRGQVVLTLELFGAPPGNKLLMANGAKVIRSRQHLEEALDYLDADGSKQLTLM